MTDADLADAIAGLAAGDFSRLEPRFIGEPAPIVVWVEAGAFADHPEELAEALTCACFLGHVGVASFLLARGVAPSGGARTGLDALHWAANRGQLAAVQLLIAAGAPLDTRSMYGSTAIETAEWAAIHEPRSDHAAIIAALRSAALR